MAPKACQASFGSDNQAKAIHTYGSQQTNAYHHMLQTHLADSIVCPNVLQKLAVEAAIKGEFVRPSERRRQQLLETAGSGNGYGTGDPRGDPAGYGA